MDIRPATTADARPLAELHVASWKSAFPGLLPQDYLDTLRPEDRLPMWEEALVSSPWPVVLVGEEKGSMVGFAAVGASRDAEADPATTGELYMLYLAPSAFGSGAAIALHDAALRCLTEASFRSAILWVLHSNARARRFYERHGWRADGSSKEHDWEAFVATDVRYRRSLADGPKLVRTR